MIKTVHIQRCHRRAGYNLVEVMIGMLILAIALAWAFQLSITNARLTENNRNRAVAANLAEMKLEQLRNTSFDNITSGADGSAINAMGEASASGLFTRSWAVGTGAPGYASNNLLTVVVTVNWTQGGATRTYTLSGVIGR